MLVMIVLVLSGAVLDSGHDWAACGHISGSNCV